MNTVVSLILALSMLGTTAGALDSAPALQDGIQIEIPETITVRVTGEMDCGDGTFDIAVFDFKEYVTGVLAAEWGNKWHINSLKAGAVAVKMYAMRAIEEDPKWKAMPWAQDRVADVYDCVWDMAYRPDWVNDKVRKAIDETWDYFLVNEDGSLFYTYFNAWDSGCYIRGEYGQCLGQWQSMYMAVGGTDWRNILLHYYHDGVIVTNGGYLQTQYEVALDNEWIDGESNAYIVRAGDTLIGIAKKWYGTSDMYMAVYEANKDNMLSPGLILEGQILLMPEIEETEDE